MRLLLLAVLPLLFLFADGVDTEKMTLIPITTANPPSFTVGVNFPPQIEGDQAIVRIFYYVDSAALGIEFAPGHRAFLMRVSTCVIPVVPGTAVMADSVPALREKVKKIEVTVVTNGQKQTFEEF